MEENWRGKEMRGRGTFTHQIIGFKFKILKFQIKDLKEHNEYKFRIKAFNAVGVGEPGNSSSIIAKNPYGPLPLNSISQGGSGHPAAFKVYTLGG